MDAAIHLLQKPCRRVIFSLSTLKVPDHTRHRSMLGHRHHSSQRNALFASFGNKSGAQAVTSKISLKSGDERPPLHDTRYCRRRQGRAQSIPPNPSKDRPLRDARCL